MLIRFRQHLHADPDGFGDLFHEANRQASNSREQSGYDAKGQGKHQRGGAQHAAV